MYLFNKIRNFFYKISIIWDKISLPNFSNNVSGIKNNIWIASNRKIINSREIKIGHDVYIGQNSFIAAITQRGIVESLSNNQPKLKIGNRVSATGMLQIHALKSIEIGDDVLIATNVFMCDAQHGYYNTDEPYKDQKMFKIAPITIGRGTWIGQNVVILPGVDIGEFVIIGANSVVNRSIPSKSIAVGNPARIIKVWDESKKEFITVSKEI